MLTVRVLGYWGAYPAAGEATSGYLIETEFGKVLLDCGSGVLAQLARHCSVNDLSAVLVTHHHHDHTADLGVLGYSVLLSRLTGQRQHSLPLFMPTGNTELAQELSAEPFLDVVTLDADSCLTIAGMSIRFQPTVHPIFCLAVRIEYQGKVFVFSADAAVSDELVQFAQGADLFLCEASLYDGQELAAQQAGHLTARQAGSVGKRAQAKRLVLTHYPHYGDLSVLQQQAAEGFDGLAERVHTGQVLTV